MVSIKSAVGVLAVVVLCSALGAQAACCTMGQPTYSGSKLNFEGLPTCSDGPCKGAGFNYFAVNAVQSPDPDSCCDTENETAFYHNPQAGSGLTWPPIPGFPKPFPGTGRKCNPESVKFRCSISGKEGNNRRHHRHLLA